MKRGGCSLRLPTTQAQRGSLSERNGVGHGLIRDLTLYLLQS